MDATRRLLTTNGPPDPGEAATINAQIQGLVGSIFQMESQLQSMKDELKQHRIAVSGMRCMPREVLGEIFLSTEPVEQEVSALGLVCKGWRDATLSTHRLWNTVTVHNTRSLGPGSHEKITVWFGRAGSIPRKLRLSEDDANVDRGRCKASTCHMLNPELHRLLTEGPRVDEISLLCKGPFCLQRLLAALNSTSQAPTSQERPWDCIRSLDVEFDRCSTWVRRPALVATRQETLFTQLPPNITSLTLQLPDVYTAFYSSEVSSMIDLNIPRELLGNLIYLKLECNWNGGHILTLLEHCQNLETLEIDPGCRRPWYGVDDLTLLHRLEPGIRLPKLQTFRLLSGLDLHFLDCLVPPAIQTLDFDLQGINGSDEVDEGEIYASLNNFITLNPSAQESVQNLRLRLRDTHLTVSELTVILSKLRSLKHLTLDAPEVDVVGLFRSLMRADPPPAAQASGVTEASNCLPDLEVLRLLNIPAPSPSLRRIFSLLTMRGPRQCRVDLSFKKPRKIPQEEDLRDSWPTIALIGSSNEGRPTLRRYGVSVNILPSSSGFLDGL